MRVKVFSAFDAYFKTQMELWQAVRSTGIRCKLCYGLAFFNKQTPTNKAPPQKW